MFVSCLVTFGFGVFLFALSSTKIVKNDLNSINESAKTKRHRLQALNQISDFIQFHSSLKRYKSMSMGPKHRFFI